MTTQIEMHERGQSLSYFDPLQGWETGELESCSRPCQGRCQPSLLFSNTGMFGSGSYMNKIRLRSLADVDQQMLIGFEAWWYRYGWLMPDHSIKCKTNGKGGWF